MSEITPRHGEVTVEVDDVGDAFVAVCRVSRALRRSGYGSEVDAFLDEALAAGEPTLPTCGRWVRLVTPAAPRR
ncbi:MAG TPA: hypothetical protein VMB72_08000 [Acidimicrobiales bacterium]|nr:hypothetical protein [Acidimicrobiales bacterium]